MCMVTLLPFTMFIWHTRVTQSIMGCGIMRCPQMAGDVAALTATLVQFPEPGVMRSSNEIAVTHVIYPLRRAGRMLVVRFFMFP